MTEVIELLERSIVIGDCGCICCHGERTRLLLGWMDVPFGDSRGFGRVKSPLGMYGIARTLCEP